MLRYKKLVIPQNGPYGIVGDSHAVQSQLQGVFFSSGSPLFSLEGLIAEKIRAEINPTATINNYSLSGKSIDDFVNDAALTAQINGDNLSLLFVALGANDSITFTQTSPPPSSNVMADRYKELVDHVAQMNAPAIYVIPFLPEAIRVQGGNITNQDEIDTQITHMTVIRNYLRANGLPYIDLSEKVIDYIWRFNAKNISLYNHSDYSISINLPSGQKVETAFEAFNAAVYHFKIKNCDSFDTLSVSGGTAPWHDIGWITKNHIQYPSLTGPKAIPFPQVLTGEKEVGISFLENRVALSYERSVFYDASDLWMKYPRFFKPSVTAHNALAELDWISMFAGLTEWTGQGTDPQSFSKNIWNNNRGGDGKHHWSSMGCVNVIQKALDEVVFVSGTP